MNVTLSQIIDATWITIYISLFSFILGSIIAFILGFSLYFTRKGGIYENTKTYIILDVIIMMLLIDMNIKRSEKKYNAIIKEKDEVGFGR